MIYTTGYTGLKIEKLIAKAEELDAYLVDIRLKPWSRNKTWTQSNMIQVFKDRYVAGGNYFGNIHYKSAIEYAALKDWNGGLRFIEKLLAGKDKNIIFICMCRNHDDCHRKLIKANLEAKGVGVEELNYTAPTLNKILKQTSIQMSF